MEDDVISENYAKWSRVEPELGCQAWHRQKSTNGKMLVMIFKKKLKMIIVTKNVEICMCYLGNLSLYAT